MSDAPQGLVRYTGLAGTLSGSFSFPIGVNPGVATLEAPYPARPIPYAGEIVVAYGGESIRFDDARVVEGSLRRDASGRIVTISVQDRRWRWAFGRISGWYNRRDDAGEVIPESEKTPRELASLLFDAMQERGYSVDALPPEPRPEVEWDATNPARALDDLASQLGCVVVLGLDGRARIAKAGVGERLPDTFRGDYGATVDPPEMPDAIEVVYGASEYQADLELEAVGEDDDGAIVPIDDLSYKPTDGWGYVDLANLAALSDGLDAERAARRGQAASMLFRAYRIAIPDDGLIVPGFDTDHPGEKITRHEQIELLDVQNDEQPGRAGVRRPAIVYGSFYADRDYTLAPAVDDPEPYEYGAAPETAYLDGFSVDARRGLILFASPLYRYVDGTTDYEKEPAVLRIRVAFRIRLESSFAHARAERRRRLSGQGRYVAPLFRNEIVLRSTVVYGPGFAVDRVATNRTAIDREADYYIDAWLRAQRTETPERAVYNDLRKIEPDGAIVHVVWKSTRSGATTEASRNTELREYVPPFRASRAVARTVEAVKSTHAAAIRRNA